MSAPVAIAIVSWNSAADLADCCASIGRLAPAPAELVLVDCASDDDSLEVARRLAPSTIPLRLLPLSENRGFAGGMNAALAASSSPWVLTLNPDARPDSDFLARLVGRALDPSSGRVGAVTGRLVRPGTPARVDACGMKLVRSWRHLDRGSGELDRGQYGDAERVFGATGAASLWSRAALADVAIDGRAFDERFHSYREDAELCFRLRARNWEVLYEPQARCVHARAVTPRGRRSVAPEINRRSLANRYLWRLTHQSTANLFATLPWTLARDLAALAWVLAVERSSLPAYGALWRERRAIGEHRRRVRALRTAAPGAVERWFGLEGEPI